MKVSEIIHGRVSTMDLQRTDGDGFPNGLVPNSEVFLVGEARDVRLQIGEESWTVEGYVPRDRDSLRLVIETDLPRIAWLVQAAPSKGRAERVLVQVHEFPNAFTWNEPVEIGVDDKVVDHMRKRRRRLISVDSVVEWLTERILLPPRVLGGNPRALLSGSPMPDAGKKTAFRLYGGGFAVDVERTGDDTLRATRVVEARRAVEGDERRPIYLATGQISFCDATVAGQFRGVARTELDNLVAQADSYLSLWREYNERERASILRRARQFGWVGYSNLQQLADGSWAFRINVTGEKAADFWKRLNALDGEQLQAGAEVPAIIQSTDADEPLQRPHQPFVGEVVGRQTAPPRLSLRPPPDQDDRVLPPEQGFLFVSLGGDEVRIRRRTSAWERIRSCTNPMPQLGMMIEGQPVPERHGRTLKPVTRAVRDVFPNPNDRQRMALEVALNSPDIALIQGPPGTGKTRVIAALQARLAEKDEGVDPDGLTGNTLLTSFQHDAVENAAAATRVMGLPAVKVGFRRGSEEARDGVELWATETAQKVRAARTQSADAGSVHAALLNVRQMAVSYLEAPGKHDEPVEVLRHVAGIASKWLPSALVEELAQLTAELSGRSRVRVDDDQRSFALKAVRALRTDAVSFSDDGPANAHKTLRRLTRLTEFSLNAEETACLEEAASCEPDAPVDEQLLARLQATRDALLDRLQTAEAGGGPRPHADVEQMIMRVIDVLNDRASQTAPGEDVAVREWLLGLENDPEGVREAVLHYSMVLAATCQQSVSRSMEDAKLGDDTIFRSVIVDEAARANPLDLLIPMALAERRIVLVGDHRQLPHILEPDIEREVEQSVQEETRSALRRSLFEKLFTELRRREKRDGVKRTVSLNVQYRMHPVLGEFISQQFYEPYGEGFASGRAEEEFAHSVTLANGTPLDGKVAAWLNVPAARGLESRGRSKSRRVEARRIAEEASVLIPRHPDLSVGIITFYAAQRDELFAQLADVDLTEPDEVGGFRVRDQWQRTTDGRERLRIGTVDAFQGKEFDIVFLSLTRSNRVEVKDEVTRRRRYGFLLLENRLCVAMSRQHRLLVVVGDAGMTLSPDAESSIPGLVAFRKLCEGSHGTIVRN